MIAHNPFVARSFLPRALPLTSHGLLKQAARRISGTLSAAGLLAPLAELDRLADPSLLPGGRG
jgi:hypothetical protein